MLKDNHLKAAGSITHAVELARSNTSFIKKIVVETESMDMVKEALEAGVDIIMLDNMSLEMMQEAVELIGGRAEIECSGNISKDNVKRLSGLGVNYISSGALTHSAPILDISMKNMLPEEI